MTTAKEEAFDELLNEEESLLFAICSLHKLECLSGMARHLRPVFEKHDPGLTEKVLGGLRGLRGSPGQSRNYFAISGAVRETFMRASCLGRFT